MTTLAALLRALPDAEFIGLVRGLDDVRLETFLRPAIAQLVRGSKAAEEAAAIAAETPAPPVIYTRVLKASTAIQEGVVAFMKAAACPVSLGEVCDGCELPHRRAKGALQALADRGIAKHNGGRTNAARWGLVADVDATMADEQQEHAVEHVLGLEVAMDAPAPARTAEETGTLAHRVRSRRRALGVSTAEIAQRCGTDRSAIMQIENGKRKNLKPPTLRRLASALACATSDLLAPVRREPVRREPRRRAPVAPSSARAAKVPAAAAGAPVPFRLNVLPIADLSSADEHFRCAPLNATIKAAACVARQTAARSPSVLSSTGGSSRWQYIVCRACPDGELVARHVGATLPVAAREGRKTA